MSGGAGGGGGLGGSGGSDLNGGGGGVGINASGVGHAGSVPGSAAGGAGASGAAGGASGGGGGGNLSTGGSGGGGLGAGGDVFVQQGATLIVEGGSQLGQGAVQGGSGASGAAGGSAYGSGVFIQGNTTVTFAALDGATVPNGQATVVSGVITDQTGSNPGASSQGAGGVIIGQSAAQAGPAANADGVVVFEAANTYTGATEVAYGTLALSTTGTINATASVTVDTGATLQIGTGGAGGSLSVAVSDDGTVAIDRSDTVYLENVVPGGVSGAGGLTQAGSGTLIIDQTQSYQGATVVQSGTLVITGAGSIASSSQVVVDAGAMLDVSGATAPVIHALSGGGTVVAPTTGVTVDETQSSAFSGAITGGPLTVEDDSTAGGHVLTFTGSSNITGGVALDSGSTLQLGDGTTGHDGPLDTAISGAGALILDYAADETFSGAIAPGVTVEVEGPGSVTFATAPQTLTVESGGTVVFTTGSQPVAAVADNGTVVFQSTAGSGGIGPYSVSQALSGAGVVDVDAVGGPITFAAAQTYAGGTVLEAGELVIGAASAGSADAPTSSAIGTGTLTMDAGTTLGFASGGNYVLDNNIRLVGDPTFDTPTGQTDTESGVISDSTPGSPAGEVVKTGGGTLMLSGANTYSGGTTISAGVLQADHVTDGDITDSAIGTGTLHFDGGVLQAGLALILDNAADVDANGATIDLNGFALTYAGVIANASGVATPGSLTLENLAGVAAGTASTLTLTAAETYTGATMVDAATTLALSGSGSIADSSGLTLANGAIFDISHLSTPGFSFGPFSVPGTTGQADLLALSGVAGSVVETSGVVSGYGVVAASPSTERAPPSSLA